MFDDAIIVQSAVSAFNNAALYAPAFLWWAVLSVPLFAMAYMYGADFLGRLGWTRQNTGLRTCVATVVMTLCWIVLFGGNYAVLRDNATVLPFMIAAIVFVASLFIASHARAADLSKVTPYLRGHRAWAVAALVILIVGLSDTHAWWGPLLQIGAVLLGVLFGRGARAEMRPIAGTLLVIGATTTAILMQPEFFRFGQLGALTAFHLLFLVLIAATLAAVVALQNINSRGAIHASAYVKLKWMFRFVAALCVVLFVMTESVPVFLGLMVVSFMSSALTIWHRDSVHADLAEFLFAAVLVLFGVITVMPVVTALGLVAMQRVRDMRGAMRAVRGLL
ncbi:MAG: hypothetical protein Q4E56_00180 [Pseudomonadota bacterium]|nr:hypothetical protein [Pseudomonadota bacterium]